MIFNILSYDSLYNFTRQSIAEFWWFMMKNLIGVELQQVGNLKKKYPYFWSKILIWSVWTTSSMVGIFLNLCTACKQKFNFQCLLVFNCTFCTQIVQKKYKKHAYPLGLCWFMLALFSRCHQVYLIYDNIRSFAK